MAFLLLPFMQMTALCASNCAAPEAARVSERRPLPLGLAVSRAGRSTRWGCPVEERRMSQGLCSLFAIQDALSLSFPMAGSFLPFISQLQCSCFGDTCPNHQPNPQWLAATRSSSSRARCCQGVAALDWVQLGWAPGRGLGVAGLPRSLVLLYPCASGCVLFSWQPWKHKRTCGRISDIRSCPMC